MVYNECARMAWPAQTAAIILSLLLLFFNHPPPPRLLDTAPASSLQKASLLPKSIERATRPPKVLSLNALPAGGETSILSPRDKGEASKLSCARLVALLPSKAAATRDKMGLREKLLLPCCCEVVPRSKSIEGRSMSPKLRRP